MNKIMFKDRYGLTQAVVEGQKTMTRRSEGGARFQEMADNADEVFYNEDDDTLDMRYEGIDIFSHKCRYKVGEVVAVVQSYESAGINFVPNRYDGSKWGNPKGMKGWRNKMYVRADIMPHRIRITGIRCERLQDISYADCLKEGVRVKFANNGSPMYYYFDTKRWRKVWFNTLHEAFASLIDKVSGCGTWGRNQWVVVYEFELTR